MTSRKFTAADLVVKVRVQPPVSGTIGDPVGLVLPPGARPEDGMVPDLPPAIEVKVERDRYGDKTWRVSTSSNGYQWTEVNVSFHTEAAAQRVASAIRKEFS